MLTRQLHQALRQVREVQQRVLASGRFRGYSGKARAGCGTAALIGAVVMSREAFPATPTAHVWAWGVVFLIGFFGNYGALVCWYFGQPREDRDQRQLLPIIDPFGPIFVGGILTLVMVMHDHHEHLFGIWMCLFGLANTSSRLVMPRGIWLLGLGYIAAGVVCLVCPAVTFLNPWPMGAVFFVGEWVGGLIFCLDQQSGGEADV